MYIFERFNSVDWVWSYINCYSTYSEACEELEILRRRWGGPANLYRIRYEEIEN